MEDNFLPEESAGAECDIMRKEGRKYFVWHILSTVKTYGRGSNNKRKMAATTTSNTLSYYQQWIFYINQPPDRIVHTTAVWSTGWNEK